MLTFIKRIPKFVYILLVVVLCVVAVFVTKSIAYSSGYSDGIDDGYSTGHDDGYQIGYDACLSDNYSDDTKSSSSGPVFATTKNFIGNTQSHKFHSPSCSFLPAEANRIYFSKRSDAISKGYDPCSKCHP